MADIKWIKIVTDIFDDEKVLLIESLPSADSIIVIWFKLLCLAGKNNNNGVFLMNDRIPYTDEMLATIFRRDINIVRLALKTFEDFGMIEIIDNVITIPNWEKHQSLDAYEKKKIRDKEYQRERRAKQKQLAEGATNKKSSDTSSDSQATTSSDVEKNRSLDKEEDIDKDIDIYNISKDILSSAEAQQIVDRWNLLGLQKLVSINPGSNRHKMLKARIKEYGLENVLKAIESINNSSFLKGQNNRNWIITFDWLIRPNNFPKVLEGNYLDKGGNNNGPTGGDGGKTFKVPKNNYQEADDSGLI